MIKNINEIEDLIFNYFKGVLSREEELSLLEWLESDAGNKKTFSELSDWWAKAHLPLFASEMRENFHERLSQITAVVPQKRKVNFSFIFKAAAILILFGLATSVAYHAGTKKNDSENPLVHYETVVPYGARTKVLLPDRSVVWLNSGSVLSYTNKFKQQRKVSLSGEAFFDVAPDSLHPFMVQSNELIVKVKGTKFNFSSYKEDKKVVIALVSGKIEVYSSFGKQKQDTITLLPHELLSYNKENEKVYLSTFEGDNYYSWMKGKICFEKESFLSIAARLERKFDLKINILSKTLPKEYFTGSFNSNYGIEEILKEIDFDHKYNIIRKGDTILIKDKKSRSNFIN